MQIDRALRVGGVVLAWLAAACGTSSPAVTAIADASAEDPTLDAAASVSDAASPSDASSPSSDAGDAHVDAGTPPVASSGVKIIVEPSDKGAALLAAVKGATKSIHMTMYLLTSTAMVDALIAASKKPGMDVKVVLNENFPNGTPTTPDKQNAAVLASLKSSGVNVVYAPPSFTYTHEKCVILDGTTAWIMTMNATVSSPTDNREYLAVDSDPDDVREAEAIFQSDFAGSGVTAFTGNLLVAPINAQPRLVALIQSAARTLDLEGETFSDTKISAALSAAAKAGVAVRVVVSTETPTTAQTQAIASVKAAGVKVVATAAPTIHAKAIVADGARAYVGSANFTYNSLANNRELGLILDAPAEVAKVSSTIALDFGNGAAQ